MRGNAGYEKDVFISYSSKNRRWVTDVLLPRLEAAGLQVIVDFRDFQLGVPAVTNIERAIDACRHTLIVMSPHWIESSWGEFEGVLAQASDPAGWRRRLIPVLLEPARLPPRIAMLTYADLTGSEVHVETEMQRLVRGLATKSRIFLTFKRGIEPDTSFAGRLRKVLEREGHQLYSDEDATVGMNQRDGLRQQIARSDFVVALLSTASVGDGAIADQIVDASLLSSHTAKARLLPVRVNYTDALPDPIAGHLNDLGYASWQSPDDDERVIRKLLDAITNFTALSPPTPEGKQTTPESIVSQAKLWPKGTVLTIGFLDGKPALQWKVAKVALEWMKYANLRFVFSDVSEATLRISFKQPGSWAFQGTDALNIPKDQPTINFGWVTPDTLESEVRRVVLHEFGHVLGLVHEHQAANARIPWDKEAVYRELSGPPNNWTRQQVDVTMFQEYASDYFPVEKAFDPKSIMMFPLSKNFTGGRLVVGLNLDLSDTDKEFVQRLYPSA